MSSRLLPANTEAAMRCIDPVFLNSAQYRSQALDSVLACGVVLKFETFNPIRSFKGRGADYYVQQLPKDARLVCGSAGNFGQAMAYSCRKHNIFLTVYASVNANPLKIERMRALGANVVLQGEDFDAAKLAAKKFAIQTGAHMVEDGLEPRISEGAGTIALELLKYPEKLDAVLIALGNGALIGGMASYIKHKSPSVRVIGVAAAGAPCMEQSWREQKIIEFPSINTIADGIGTRIPIAEALGDMRETVDDVLLVEDASMIEAMKLAHTHLGVVLEPSGAVGLASILENRARFAGQTIATVLCGGNLTTQQMQQWL